MTPFVFSPELTEYARRNNPAKEPLIRSEAGNFQAALGAFLGGNILFFGFALSPLNSDVGDAGGSGVLLFPLSSTTGAVAGAAIAAPLGHKTGAAVGAALGSLAWWSFFFLFAGSGAPTVTFNVFAGIGAGIGAGLVSNKEAQKRAKAIRKRRTKRR